MKFLIEDVDDEDDMEESEERDYVAVKRRSAGQVPKYLTIKDKVDQWEQVALRSVIRDKLYPLAKIIFNSEQELAFDGKICNVIFKHMRMDDVYKDYSEHKQKEHRKRLWAVWSDLVSRNLDMKRHNQKGQLKKIFWGKLSNHGSLRKMDSSS
jgi:hypothetical protein